MVMKRWSRQSIVTTILEHFSRKVIRAGNFVIFDNFESLDGTADLIEIWELIEVWN